MRSRPARPMRFLLLTLLLWVVGGPRALAQWDDEVVVPPPPPPEESPTYAPPPPPAPVTVAPAPAPQRIRPAPRARRRAAPWGRFYLGAGTGWVKTTALAGVVMPSSGWGYQVWAGWRRSFFGLELGYLGASLRSPGGSGEVMPLAGETDAPMAYEGAYFAPVDDRARLGHLTVDAKLYLRLLCRLSVFVRLGINHTRIVQAGWFDQSGWGWQYGTGLDYRLRLSWRPDLVLKLRGEVVKLDAALAPRGGGDRQAFSTLGLLFSLNLGWAPR